MWLRTLLCVFVANREILSKDGEEAGNANKAEGVGTWKHLAVQHYHLIGGAVEFQCLDAHVFHEVAVEFLTNHVAKSHFGVPTAVFVLGYDEIHDSAARVE